MRRLRKNSDTQSNIEPGVITSKISKGSGTKSDKYFVKIYLGGKLLLNLPRSLNTYEDAEFIASKAKKLINDIINKEIKKQEKIKNPRKKLKQNPPDRLTSGFQAAIASSLYIPEAREDAYEVGYMKGIRDALKKYCGIFNYFERRKVLKDINKALAGAYDSLDDQIDAVRRQIRGAYLPIAGAKKKVT